MSAELAPIDSRTLYAICDDLGAYHETLMMLDEHLIGALPDDERADIQRQRAEVQQSIEAICRELVGKTDAVAAVLRRQDSEFDFIDEEIDRLRKKRTAIDAARKWLRRYVVSVMQLQGIRQLKTPTNTLFLRDTEAAEVADVTLIPPQYMNAEVKLPLSLWRQIIQWTAGLGPASKQIEALRVKSEPSLSTIKNAIKSGVDVPGADLRLNTSLTVR